MKLDKDYINGLKLRSYEDTSTGFSRVRYYTRKRVKDLGLGSFDVVVNFLLDYYLESQKKEGDISPQEKQTDVKGSEVEK